MRSRLLVAAIGIPIILAAIFLRWQSGLAFALLVCAISVLALNELYQMTRQQQPFVPAGLLAGGMIPVLVWAMGVPGVFVGMVAAIPLTMIFLLLSVERRNALAAIAITLMGVMYIGIFAGLAVDLHSSAEHGQWLIVLLLAGVWLTDTGAYFGGRLLGRHKLAPRISPKKTIEGFVAGTVVGTFVVWYAHFLPPDDDRWLGTGTDALFLGIAISLSTTLGDLFESLLKRNAGVKDSGSALGEHGGFLDRIDALLVAAPVAYITAYLLGII